MNETNDEAAPIEPELMRIVQTPPELGFTVLAVAYEYRVEFKAYEVATEGGDPWWPRKSAMSSMDLTSVLAEAQVYVHGWVKWDGCSDWYFDAQDDVMLHGCTRHDLKRIGDLLTWCWDQTAKLCPKWDGVV
jgi:hypothetical protein